MKKIIALLITALLLIPAYSHSRVLVGSVDIDKIEKKTNYIQAATKAVIEEFERTKKNIAARFDEVTRLQEDYNQNKDNMTASEKNKKELMLDYEIGSYKKFSKIDESGFKDDQLKVQYDIERKLKIVVKEVSKDAKVNITIKANDSILYADDQKDLTKDLTDAVIDLFDKKYPKYLGIPLTFSSSAPRP